MLTLVYFRVGILIDHPFKLSALVGEFSRGVMVEAYLADVVGVREHCGVNCGSLTPRIGNIVKAC